MANLLSKAQAKHVSCLPGGLCTSHPFGQQHFRLPTGKSGAYAPSKSCSRFSFSAAPHYPTTPTTMCTQSYGAVRCNCVAFQCGEWVFYFLLSESKDYTSFFYTSSCAMGRATHGLLGTSVGHRQRPRAFLPFGSHPLIWSNVNGISDRIVTDSQTQVCDGAHAVFLHQDIL